MSKQKAREQFISDMSREGLPYVAIRRLLAAATGLNRISELACSSESVDRDRVAVPADMVDVFCEGDRDEAGRVPRIETRRVRIERRLSAALPAGFTANFQGDPRGAPIVVSVPSGRSDDGGRTGICVPSGPSGIRW